MTTKKQINRPIHLVGSIAYHVVAVSIALIFVLPLIWMLSVSLRRTGVPPPRAIQWIPDPIAWSNYSEIFTIVPFGQYLLNSVIVVVLAVPITLLTASWAGFAMAQLPPRIRLWLVVFSLLVFMVPSTALWLTRFLVFQQLGLINTRLALIAPALMGSSPFFVLLFYWTFRTIPSGLFEAARLDGAGTLHIWAKIALPLARPTIITVSVLAFTLYWSDFINPFLYLKSEDLYTLPVSIQSLQLLGSNHWPLLMAAATIMVIPVIVMFLLVQRYFWTEGRLAGIAG